MVVEDRGAWRGIRIEQSALPAGRHRHPHSVGNPLAERPSGDLDSVGVRVLRMPWSLGSPESVVGLDVVEFEPEAAEVELNVERQAGVAAGQHESVAAWPVRIAGIVPHHLLEQQVGDRSQAHCRAWMAIADVLHGIGGQHSYGVDGPVVESRSIPRGEPRLQCRCRSHSRARRSFRRRLNPTARRLQSCRPRHCEPIGGSSAGRYRVRPGTLHA